MKETIFQSGFIIDVQQNILAQFAEQLGCPIIDNQVAISHPLMEGQIKYFLFPGGLELYHFRTQSGKPIRIKSANPKESEWLLLNINLSTNAYHKTVNSQAVSLQKYLPMGILLYTPQTSVQSISPPNIPIEIALIRFLKSLLQQYQAITLYQLQNTKKALFYEDLDTTSEKFLLTALQLNNNGFKRHSALLAFVAHFVEKIKNRQGNSKYERLHPDDLKGLFLAAAMLRNPTNQDLPNMEELAKLAGMSRTKFKNTFKQVFGSPPFKYHQRIKMEYAQEVLQRRKMTVSEISYELGYSHPSKFTLAYKKHFNALPSNA